jgi:hypothetical protein
MGRSSTTQKPSVATNRKLSVVSAEDEQERDAVLEKMFTDFSSDGAVTCDQLVDCAAQCGFLDHSISAADVKLIFQGTKLAGKNKLNRMMFEEACRRIAVKKVMTFTEMIQSATASRNTRTMQFYATQHSGRLWKTWQKRWFVCDKDQRMIVLWSSQEATIKGRRKGEVRDVHAQGIIVDGAAVSVSDHNGKCLTRFKMQSEFLANQVKSFFEMEPWVNDDARDGAHLCVAMRSTANLDEHGAVHALRNFIQYSIFEHLRCRYGEALESAEVKALTGGFSGSVVLMVSPKSREKGVCFAPTIFKFDEEAALRDEYQKYLAFASGFTGNVVPKHTKVELRPTAEKLMLPAFSGPRPVLAIFGMEIAMAGGCWQLPGFAENSPITDLNDIYLEESKCAATGRGLRHQQVLSTFFGRNGPFHQVVQKRDQTRRGGVCLADQMLVELSDRLEGSKKRDLDAVIPGFSSSEFDASAFSVQDYGGNPLFAACGGTAALQAASTIFRDLGAGLAALPADHWAKTCTTLQCQIHGDLNAANIMVDLHQNCWIIDFSEVELDSPMRDVAKLLSVLLFQLSPADCDGTNIDAESMFDAMIKAAKGGHFPPTISKTTVEALETAAMALAAGAINTTLRLAWARLEDAVPEQYRRAEDNHPAMFFTHLMLNSLATLHYSQLGDRQRRIAYTCATKIGSSLLELLDVPPHPARSNRKQSLQSARALGKVVGEEILCHVDVDEQRKNYASQAHEEHGTVINPITGAESDIMTRCVNLILEDTEDAKSTIGPAGKSGGSYDKIVEPFKCFADTIPDGAAAFAKLGSQESQLGKIIRIRSEGELVEYDIEVELKNQLQEPVTVVIRGASIDHLLVVSEAKDACSQGAHTAATCDVDLETAIRHAIAHAENKAELTPAEKDEISDAAKQSGMERKLKLVGGALVEGAEVFILLATSPLRSGVVHHTSSDDHVRCYSFEFGAQCTNVYWRNFPESVTSQLATADSFVHCKCAQSVSRDLLFVTHPAVVTADPAGGKTTFDKQTVMHVMREEKHKSLVPVMVRTIDLVRCEEQLDLEQDLVDQYLQLNYTELRHKLFNQARQEGRLLLILDGLDEAGSMEGAIVTEIATRLLGEVHLIITSRPISTLVANNVFAHFRRFSIKPLSTEQQRQVVSGFFGAEEEKTTEDFMSQIDKKQNETLHGLAQNPLQLNLILSVYKQGLTEDTKLTKIDTTILYHTAVDGILHRVQDAKQRLGEVTTHPAPSYRHALQHVAFTAHMQKKRDFKDEDLRGMKVKQEDGTVFTLREWQVFVETTVKTGQIAMLTWFLDEGHETYRFAHLMLQVVLIRSHLL